MPEYTGNQLEAIDYRRLDACVVAGPGSGKTTVLVERYRRLIVDHGFEPRNILAITFTEKAAANMKAKLAELFAHDPIRLRDLESAYVSTIHGFCARILKENAIAAGIDPRFTVLDARESDELQYSCLNAALDRLVAQRRADAIALIDALHTPYPIGDLKNAYDGIRSAGRTVSEVHAMGGPSARPSADITARGMAETLRRLVGNWPAILTPSKRLQRGVILEWAQRLSDADSLSFEDFVQLVKAHPIHLGKVPESEREALEVFRDTLPELIASAVDRHTAPFRALVFQVLTHFDELYSGRKLELGALDFNDLERRAIGLLRENPDVQARIRTQFRQVMLDEFQDINQQQSDLIDLVRGDDVFFAVGDINQSIYGFRHARTEIFQRYRAAVEELDKHSANLLHNFRSRYDILRCVEALLNSAEGIEPRALVPGASFAHKPEPSIEVLKIHTAQNDEADAEEDEPAAMEAHWIAHRVLSLRGGLQLGTDGKTRFADFADFAVLCRNSESMRSILGAFDNAGIPYVSGRRQSFLLSREGRDITALLHVISNPRDSISLATVLRSPLVGIGDEALLRIRLLAGSLPGGLNMISYDNAKLADFSPDDAGKLKRFVRNLKSWREEQPVIPLELLLVRALTDCGFAWIPGSVHADNVESFLHLARTKGEQRGLPEMLTEIENLANAVNLESDLSDKDQGNRVQVMTAHAAKGLEFPIAIIAAMDKGTQRNSAPVTFTPDFGLGLTWKDRRGKPKNTGLPDSWHLRNAAFMDDREKKEEHRLLYVAMTRAEEHLILSWSRGKRPPQNWAKRVNKLFGLDSFAPSTEPHTTTIQLPNSEPFDLSVLVKDSEPPDPTPRDLDAVLEKEILTIPRAEITGQHDSAVNVTSLAVFADCPRKYYLQRYIGWNGRSFSGVDFDEDLPEPENDDDLSAADLGTAVHEILAGRLGSWPDEPHLLANVFLESELGKSAAASTRSAREWDFIIDVDGTLVRGSVDLWFEDESGEIIVVDYKTDTHVRPEAYAPQLALYGLAIERALGKNPAHAYLHFLRPNTLIEIPLDPNRVKDLLTDLRKAQDSLKFDLREADRCRSCQFYRGLCPAGLNASPELPDDRMPSRSAAVF